MKFKFMIIIVWFYSFLNFFYQIWPLKDKKTNYKSISREDIGELFNHLGVGKIFLVKSENTEAAKGKDQSDYTEILNVCEINLQVTKSQWRTTRKKGKDVTEQRKKKQ